MQLSSLILFIWRIGLVACVDGPGNYFINPTEFSSRMLFIDSLQLWLDTKFTITWYTNETTYAIYLWQQLLNGEGTKIGNNPVHSMFGSSRSAVEEQF